MAKNPWATPSKDTDPFRAPSKKSDQKPVELRKATYVKKNVLGKEERSEGRGASKASRRDKDRWR